MAEHTDSATRSGDLTLRDSTTGRGDLILLTGATGYVGGRLLRALEENGRSVRCLVLPSQILPHPDSPRVGIAQGDVLDPVSLRAAMQGVHTAYYLVHKAASSGPFEDDTRRAAVAFAAAAREAGIARIIYLGGLGGGKYSGQLCGTQEVGAILRESGAQVVEFHTSLIVGSGSLAFEMARAIVDKVMIMTVPRWARTPAHPIAIEDVVAYLVAALDAPVVESAYFEIGGADQATFCDLLRELARQRGQRRIWIPLPVLAPRLSILWLSLATPIYARIGQELVSTLCDEPRLDFSAARRVFPVRPRGIAETIQRALNNEGRTTAESHWFDALRSPQPKLEHAGFRFGPRIVDSRSLDVPHSPTLAFQPIERIGGDTGWYASNWLWKLRGLLDSLAGGVGAHRGRRDPESLAVGDPVDFWRVEAIERGRLLRLAAEMKLPGRAWLQFEIEKNSHGSRIRQTAIFDPIGIPGLLYWYALSPAHELIFNGMLNGIARAIPQQTVREAPQS